mmetsp:Transcript_10733/g.39413  ORF Transcript_10733/g.39413 Transcript_10733/m.39413 type:complete len:227 (-) Transcript_10733:1156-1836(-)
MELCVKRVASACTQAASTSTTTPEARVAASRKVRCSACSCAERSEPSSAEAPPPLPLWRQKERAASSANCGMIRRASRLTAADWRSRRSTTCTSTPRTSRRLVPCSGVVVSAAASDSPIELPPPLCSSSGCPMVSARQLRIVAAASLLKCLGARAPALPGDGAQGGPTTCRWRCCARASTCSHSPGRCSIFTTGTLPADVSASTRNGRSSSSSAWSCHCSAGGCEL